ncbi:18451_t:CDS:1, partial [Funneliformis geosporum]
KMNQFERCRIGSKIFSSTISLRHEKRSYILAKFIMNDDVINCYPGQVQYYFTHTVDLQYRLTEHFLAYVCWYQPASSLN